MKIKKLNVLGRNYNQINNIYIIKKLFIHSIKVIISYNLFENQHRCQAWYLSDGYGSLNRETMTSQLKFIIRGESLTTVYFFR